MNEMLQNKALEYLNIFEEAIKNYTPLAVDMMLKVIQIDLITNIVVGIIFFGLGFLGIFIWRKMRAGADLYDQALAYWMGGIATLWPFLVSLIMLCNVWTWVGLFEPKLYIAHKIFDRATEAVKSK